MKVVIALLRASFFRIAKFPHSKTEKQNYAGAISETHEKLF